MAFVPVSSRVRVRGPRDGGRIWAVGSRIYVNCPAPDRAIVLTDEWDRVAGTALDDGAEVEVRAWRPRGTAGARYHVRALDGAGEGWLGADRLRRTREMPAAPPPVDPTPTPVVGDPSPRRFGRR